MGHGVGKSVLTGGYDLVVMPHRHRVPIEDLIACGASERVTPRLQKARILPTL
jgi:hypothetical protein